MKPSHPTRVLISPCIPIVLGMLIGVTFPRSLLIAQEIPFQFKDVAKATGLSKLTENLKGHGAAWGDLNSDGFPDLYLGTFHYEGAQPNVLLINNQGRFALSADEKVRISCRATGILLADFDNDDDLDLYIASMPGPEGGRLAKRHGHPFAGCSLFRNEGDATFSNVSQGNGACPLEFGGRSATLLDFDGDGLLDLLVGEDPIKGYNGSKTHSSRLFRNEGNLKFTDVSQQAGLSKGIAGLGVAAADLNEDSWPDFIIVSTLGIHLFLNDGKGRFTEDVECRKIFHWPTAKGDDMICGVTIGDVNGDRLPDVFIGQHYSQPWVEPVPNRLYLHRGLRNEKPIFEDVTERVGLTPLPLKAPHVEIQDFDNDGQPDLFCSLIKFKGVTAYPLIFHHKGTQEGLPRFEQHALGVNNFPTTEDKAVKRSGAFFEKMIKEGKISYTAPAPTADFNRDGKLDIVFPSWWEEQPVMLLQNESKSGHWLEVTVKGTEGVNRMGMGSKVTLYQAGHLEEKSKMLGHREIAIGFGYASAQEAVVHFGLGEHTSCDLVVTLPHGKGVIVRQKVKANQRLVISSSEKHTP